MEFPMHRTRLLPALVVLTPLAACSTPDLNEIAQACPSAAVLAQAAEITRTRPGGTTRNDVVLHADMQRPTLSCDYERGDAQVTINAVIPMTIRTGPAGGEAQALPYFVAIVDAEGNIISKRIFQRNVPANAGTQNVTERVGGTTIGLPQNRMPYHFQFLVGFQLTADEYARNQGEPIYRP